MPRKTRRKLLATNKPAPDPMHFRIQHGPITEPQRIADPETGCPVAVRRAVDTLGMMLANGTITWEMAAAAEQFRISFRAAALDPLRAANLLRTTPGSGDTTTERSIAARNRIAMAMAALGGPGAPAGSCAWHVVGCESSIREWASNQGWGGRMVGPPQAQGILVAALGMLAAHYGLVKPSRIEA